MVCWERFCSARELRTQRWQQLPPAGVGLNFLVEKVLRHIRCWWMRQENARARGVASNSQASTVVLDAGRHGQPQQQQRSQPRAVLLPPRGRELYVRPQPGQNTLRMCEFHSQTGQNNKQHEQVRAKSSCAHAPHPLAIEKHLLAKSTHL